MPRNITITFEDGTSHAYQGVPDNVTPDMVQGRALKEFGKGVTNIDGGSKVAAPEPESALESPIDLSGRSPEQQAQRQKAGQDVINAISDSTAGVGRFLATNLVGAGEALKNKLTNPSMEQLISGDRRSWLKRKTDEQEKITHDNEKYNAEIGGPMYTGTKLAADVAITAPVGGLLGKLATKLGAPVLGGALSSSGMAKTAYAGEGAKATIKDLMMRAAGGAGAGAAGQALTDDGNFGIGARIGAAIPVLGQGAKAGYNLGKKIIGPRSAKGMAEAEGNFLVDALEGDAEKVASKLSQSDMVNGVGRNAGEASVDSGSTIMSALQNMLKGRAPDEVLKRKDMVENARAALIDGGDANTIKAAKAARNKETIPMMEQALQDANVAGKVAPRIEGDLERLVRSQNSAYDDAGKLRNAADQHQKAADNFFPVEGMPKVPGRYSADYDYVPKLNEVASDAKDLGKLRSGQIDFKQRQLDSLEQEGYKALSVKGVADKLTSKMTASGNNSSTVIQKSLGAIRDKVINAVDKRGIPDARELHTIRKEAGDTIADFIPESKKWDKKYAAGLIKDVQSAIDDAIEEAGGTTWKPFLKRHSEMSDEITGMGIKQDWSKGLRDSLDTVERPKSFASAVNKSEVDNGDLSRYLAPKDLRGKDKVLADLQNEARSQSMAKLGYEEARRRTTQKLTPTELPKGMLNPKVTLINKLLEGVQGKSSESLLRQLAKDTLDPSKTARLIREELARRGDKSTKHLRLKELMARTAVLSRNE